MIKLKICFMLQLKKMTLLFIRKLWKRELLANFTRRKLHCVPSGTKEKSLWTSFLPCTVHNVIFNLVMGSRRLSRTTITQNLGLTLWTNLCACTVRKGNIADGPFMCFSHWWIVPFTLRIWCIAKRTSQMKATTLSEKLWPTICAFLSFRDAAVSQFWGNQWKMQCTPWTFWISQRRLQLWEEMLLKDDALFVPARKTRNQRLFASAAIASFVQSTKMLCVQAVSHANCAIVCYTRRNSRESVAYILLTDCSMNNQF